MVSLFSVTPSNTAEASGPSNGTLFEAKCMPSTAIAHLHVANLCGKGSVPQSPWMTLERGRRDRRGGSGCAAGQSRAALRQRPLRSTVSTHGRGHTKFIFCPSSHMMHRQLPGIATLRVYRPPPHPHPQRYPRSALDALVGSRQLFHELFPIAVML